MYNMYNTCMKKMRSFFFDEIKNAKLKAERGISFQQIILELEADREINVVKHPNSDKYPNQQVFIVEINGYVYAVPFVEDDNHYFLKTIFPSRKLTKKYLSKVEIKK